MYKFTINRSMHRSQQHEDSAAQCWAMALKVVWGLSLVFVCQSAQAQAMYRLVPLGSLKDCACSQRFCPVYPLQPAGLNGAGQVVGTACHSFANGTPRAFLWKNDGTPMVDLGPPEASSRSYGRALNASGLVAGTVADSTSAYVFLSSGDGTPVRKITDGLGGNNIDAYAINDLGQLTGHATTAGDSAYHAFVWKNDGSPMRDLGTFGGDNSYAQAINASGQVVGASYLPGNAVYHAFIWKNDGTPMIDLGTLGGDYSDARLINTSGQVAGYSSLPSVPLPASHAFFWRNDGTPIQDLGTLGGVDTEVFALNDSGQIAGFSYTQGSDDNKRHAFVWLNDGRPMKDLGTFGGTISEALDINSSGQVTGDAYFPGNAVSHAFLWRNDGTKIHDLNTLIDPTDALKPYITLTFAYFINDRGDILAHGVDSRIGMPSGLYLLQGAVLTLSPHSLAFGNHPIHTASAAKAVTLTNTSAKVVAITSIALTGAASGQFASTNNCGSSLVGHATCTIKLTFKPTTKGAKSASLNVYDGGGGLHSVKLTGTGT